MAKKQRAPSKQAGSDAGGLTELYHQAPKIDLPGEAGRHRSFGFGGWLSQSNRAYRAILQRRFATHGIQLLQWGHLRALWEQDGQSQADICRRLGIRKSSSTSVLASLVKQSLVRRVSDATDGRKALFYLTAAGRKLEAPLTACVADAHRQAGKGMSDREKDILFSLLAKIILNCEADTKSGKAEDLPED